MGWLVDRLTPYKQEQPRWHDLAVALETYWDTYQTPAVERIEHMRSVFTADNEDLEMLLKEAGVQFEVAIPVVRDNLAFAYSWRAYEIHRKDRQETIEQILKRDYSGVFVRWEALFAPKSRPYGDVFFAESELAYYNLAPEDVHRTYRGKVMANLTGLNAIGVRKEVFRENVRRKLEVLRPAHIVYSGEMFFQVFRAEVEPISVAIGGAQSQSHSHVLLALSPYRYDDVGADEQRLDHQTLGFAHQGGHAQRAEFWPAQPWQLDLGLPGVEGDARSRAGMLSINANSSYLLSNFTLRAKFKKGDKLLSDTIGDVSFTLSAPVSASAGSQKVTRHVPALASWPATKGPRLDDVPADFCPLDMTYEVTNG
jgi:hypothetical protein